MTQAQAARAARQAHNGRYTPNTNLGAVLKNPFGYDILYLIAEIFKIPFRLIDNPLVRLLPIKLLKRFARDIVNDEFLAFFCETLDAYNFQDKAPKGAAQSGDWYRRAVGYQVYVRSFCDSNGDGVGDLPGLVGKLDYLKELGVDFIWLSPIYESPNDDNGYDISDYKKIMREFGTMADFDELMAEAKARDIKIILDMVVNHTSDEHEWFEQSRAGKDNAYRDFYIWRDPAQDGGPPNNWHSIFSGPAWEYDERSGQYYLHSYSKKMPDLNWKNPDVRKAVCEMMNWWCQKGVAGFRLDVINQIDKPDDFPNANEAVGELMGYLGCEYYFFGPRAHEYLNELHENVFGPNGSVTVGETPGTGLKLSRLFTAKSREELTMVFNFDHIFLPGGNRFTNPANTLENLKRHLVRWQTQYGADCWNSLFFDNHDNPRMLSRIDKREEFREPLAKLMAALEFTLCGTPFIYQGQELGMPNCEWELDELRDIESINYYHENLERHGAEKMLDIVACGSRDNARTPMPWTGEPDLGFSSGEPWLKPNPSYKTVNAAAARENADSVLSAYRALIQLRKANEGLIYGEFTLRDASDGYLCYSRLYKDEEYYIELNLKDGDNARKKRADGFELLYSSYVGGPAERLRAYEANIYKQTKNCE